MLALLKKEINAFFASPMGYLVIGLFLIVNGLFLWLFKGSFNVFDYGQADLSSFFLLAPWVLLFLIPAVTMRSFSEERRQGTLELLLTKPLSKLQIVLGKYAGAFALILLALLPTLLYAYTVEALVAEGDALDTGSTIGSYLGLLFLAAAYTAIGLFASSLSDNQIVAFLAAIFLCLLFYIGFEGLADITSSTVEQLGMSYHYKSISRGVIDTRDLLYFLSLTAIFIAATAFRLQSGKAQQKARIQLGILAVALIGLNAITQGIYKRFDMTEDQRYTLDPAAKTLLEDVDSPILVDVFLEGSGFSSELRMLQNETRQLLEEFAAINSNIDFAFINPLEDPDMRDANLQALMQRGLTPMQLNVSENGRQSQEIVIPWALASYNDLTVKIPLFKNNIGADQQDNLSNSVQRLEYAFADAFKKLIQPKNKKIAVLQGNGQLQTRYVEDFLKTIRDYYYIAPFTLDSVASNPQKTLKNLSDFDLIISAKPSETYSEEEKYVLDQYTMQGGNSLWLVETVAMDRDSLYNEEGRGFATMRDLNLTDMFFKYGVRINPVLVNDMYSAPIPLAIGEGSEAQIQPIQWQFSPLANPLSSHPIVNNVDLVKFDFANQIDTLKNEVSKTILLKSSPLTKLVGTPREIHLDDVTKTPDQATYNKGPQNLAVLLEGGFTSAYKNRVKPFAYKDHLDASKPAKMLVIADGDVVKNDLSRQGSLELGFDRSTGRLYGNKEFLLNSVNFLLDDTGLINIRSKEIKLAFLDLEKIEASKTQWQLINIVVPLVLLGIFGGAFHYIRRKKYSA